MSYLLLYDCLNFKLPAAEPGKPVMDNRRVHNTLVFVNTKVITLKTADVSKSRRDVVERNMSGNFRIGSVVVMNNLVEILKLYL